MRGDEFSPTQVPPAPFRYRFLRTVIRIWVTLFFRRVRCLNPEALPGAGPALLIIGHPGSFLDALLLVAAFERPVHCFLDRRFLQGLWRELFSWFLGFIPFEAEGEGSRQAIERACEVLGHGHTLLTFAEDRVAKPGEAAHLYSAAAAIAVQAESNNSGQLGLEMFPVHLFLPVAQLYSSELLIYIDAPLIPGEFLGDGGNVAAQARALAAASEEACGKNVFRLHSEEISQFLSDLKDVLRTELQEDWAARPNWKQKVDEFELSGFVAEWVDHLNRLHPGQLAALRDSVDTFREARRRCALGQLEVEQAGTWMGASWRRITSWIESVAGLPLALYALINHLAPVLILYGTGLLKTKAGEVQTMKWLIRGLVVVACYALQIWLCAHWFGRTIAGYYALALPVSGAYLWRYAWLAQHRTRLLFLDARVGQQTAKLVPMRKTLIREINAARNVYVEMVGLPY